MKKLFLILSALLCANFIFAQEKTDQYGRTPLFYAESYEKAIKLIDKGAGVMHQDNAGVDPLMSTVFYFVGYGGRQRNVLLSMRGDVIEPWQAELAKALIDSGVLDLYTEQEKEDLFRFAYKYEFAGSPASTMILEKLGKSKMLSKLVNEPDSLGMSMLLNAEPYQIEELIRHGGDICDKRITSQKRYRDNSMKETFDYNEEYGVLHAIGLVYFLGATYIKDDNCAQAAYYLQKYYPKMKKAGCFSQQDAEVIEDFASKCPKYKFDY